MIGPRRPGERGAGTLLIGGVLLLVAVLTAAGVVVGVFAAAQKQTAGAADLAALSGAAAYESGGDACASAGTIARANGTQVTHCTVSGDALDFVVAVSVERRVELLPALAPVAQASAQAGRLSSGR